MSSQIPSQPGRDGREARTALSGSPRFKAVLAATGAISCLTLAAVTWAWGWHLTGAILLAVGVWALADVVWQWIRHRRRNRDKPTRKGRPT